MLRIYQIGKYERGLLFRGRDFVDVLKPGRHMFWDPLLKLRLDREDVTMPELDTPWLDVIAATLLLVLLQLKKCKSQDADS